MPHAYIEDAVILADVLSHTKTARGSVEHALKVYDEIRRPFAQNVQDMSHDSGEAIWLVGPRMRKYTVEDSASGKIPHDELELVLREDTLSKYLWAWETTLRRDRERAIEMLQTGA